MNKEIVQHVDDWYKDRPTMDEHNSVETLKQLLCGEVEEMCESGADLREELADVLLFTVALFRKLAINAGVDTDTYIQQAVSEKVAMNHIQHSAYFYKDGNYDESRKRAKSYSEDRGLKEDFYGRNP